MESSSPSEPNPHRQEIILNKSHLEKSKAYWESIMLTPEETKLLSRTHTSDIDRMRLAGDKRLVAQDALVTVLPGIIPDLWSYIHNDGNPKWTSLNSLKLTTSQLYSLEIYLTEAIKASKKIKK